MGLSWGDIPLVGGFLGDSRSDKAGKAKLEAMRDAAMQYASYRPIAMQQRMNALNNLAGLFTPVNAALGQMYGPRATFDTGLMTQSPVISQNMFPAWGIPGQTDETRKTSLNWGGTNNEYTTPAADGTLKDTSDRKAQEMAQWKEYGDKLKKAGVVK